MGRPREHDVARVLPHLSGEMIRITEKLEGSDATVKVDGRLMSADTELLVQACQRHAGPVVVDLSDLHFADDAGIRVLQELKAQGARIVGARPYVSLQLAGQDGPIGGAR
jgi:anti-anti-sigma regulatory factor